MPEPIKTLGGLEYVLQPRRTVAEATNGSNDHLSKPYLLLTDSIYISPRYGKSVSLAAGMRSDGATYAIDIPSSAWWIHDALCNRGRWDDGTKISNWQCSQVLSDILKAEGRWVRSRRWKYMTFLFGGGKARENGMFLV